MNERPGQPVADLTYLVLGLVLGGMFVLGAVLLGWAMMAAGPVALNSHWLAAPVGGA